MADLSDAEVKALLDSPEGQLFLAEIQHQLGVIAFIETQVERALRTQDRFRKQIDALLDKRLGKVRGAGQQQAFRHSPEFLRISRGLDAIVERARGTQRDALIEALTKRLTKDKGAKKVGLKSLNVRGQTPDQIFKQWQGQTLQRIKARITLGLAEGATADAVRTEVNGLVRRARQGAEALTRTIANHTMNRAREVFLRSEGYEFVRYVAILDSRTTDICRNLAGRVFPIGEGPRPPQHYQCRSFITPATSNRRALGRLTKEQVERVTGEDLDV